MFRLNNFSSRLSSPSYACHPRVQAKEDQKFQRERDVTFIDFDVTLRANTTIFDGQSNSVKIKSQ